MKKIFILIVIIIFASGVYLSEINSPAGTSSEITRFVVLPGESAKDVSQKLEDAKLINSSFYFDLYVWQKRWQTKFQAGIHYLSSDMKMKEIAADLVSRGNSNDEITIKIIEGWSNADIAKYFDEQGIFKQKDFLTAANPAAAQAHSADYDFLSDKTRGYDLEGYLFPDTYRIFTDASVSEVISKLLANFDLKLTEQMRQDIKEQGKSIYEIVTMASLIEKEVRSSADMAIVSGIFWNRIKSGQPLQSCATLAYILGEDKKQYTTEDTNIDSPYNTYRRQGLPPGPICNPGSQAIKAAIYPQDTDYNYFLSRSSDGQTIFSKTYEEHLRNKAKYIN